MPETLAAVWTEVSSFFTTSLDAAITIIVGVPLLIAPMVVKVGGKAIGMAKSLFGISGRRR